MADTPAKSNNNLIIIGAVVVAVVVAVVAYVLFSGSSDSEGCSAGQERDSSGNCVVSCPAGQENVAGVCASSCQSWEKRSASGICFAESCPDGEERSTSGVCVATADDFSCPIGESRDASGECIVEGPRCPTGEFLSVSGECVCATDQIRDDLGRCIGLETSDPVVRRTFQKNSNPTLNRLLRTSPKGIISRVTSTVNSIGEGKLNRAFVRFIAPRQGFSVNPISTFESTLDISSYNRYNEIASMVDSIDVNETVAFINKTESLFNEAQRDLGYPDGNFKKELLEAIDKVLDAPIVTKKIQLIRPSVMYKFADKSMEGMNDVSKLMVRMGPKNTRMIQAKLKEFKAALQNQ